MIVDLRHNDSSTRAVSGAASRLIVLLTHLFQPQHRFEVRV
jgi:hypothetical protein